MNNAVGYLKTKSLGNIWDNAAGYLETKSLEGT